MSSPVDTSAKALAACAEREARMRRSVYPRWVQGGRMKQADADREIAQMEAIAAHFGELAKAEARASELPGLGA